MIFYLLHALSRRSSYLRQAEPETTSAEKCAIVCVVDDLVIKSSEILIWIWDEISAERREM